MADPSAGKAFPVSWDQFHRDARALADACVLGAYRPAHRLSDAQRQKLLDLAQFLAAIVDQQRKGS